MSTPLPDLSALRLLVAVGRHGSIGGAARECGVTQQAASERLRSAEAQTGLTLLRRGPRGSTLTEAGVVVAEWATGLLDAAHEVGTAIEGLRADRGRGLNVWASMTVAESLVPRWLVQLRQRQQAEGYEPTTVSLRASNSSGVADAVRDGTAHVGFVEGVEAPTGLRAAPVAHDELVLVAPPGTPLARRRAPLTPAEVARLPMTSRERGSGTREVLERALAAHDLRTGDAVAEVTTGTALRQAVLAGGSPAFVSRRVVARDLDVGELVAVPTAGLDLGRTFRAVWAGSAQPPAGPVRDLVALARAAG